MKAGARDWLPVGVGENARASLVAIVAAWSVDWFHRKDLNIQRLSSKPPASGWAEGDGWMRQGCDIAVKVSQQGVGRLAEAALDVSGSALSKSIADAHLLDAFVKGIVRDLAERLEAALGSSLDPRSPSTSDRDRFGRDGGLEIILAQGEGPAVLTLAIALAAVLPMVRRQMPPRTPKPSLASLTTALKDIRLDVEVSLGEARLSLEDLCELTRGDIVDLGAGLHHTVQLSLAGSPLLFAEGQLTEFDGALAISLQARRA